MRAGRTVVLSSMLAVSVLVAPGCSGKPVTCSATGTTLSVTAKATAFNTSCLAVPANEAFAVTLTNRDAGVEHNWLLSVAFAPGSKTLFQGDPIKGPGSVTYQVAGVSPGRYSFECSLHPGQMHGTFIVPAPSPSPSP